MLRSTRPSYIFAFPEPETRAFNQLLAERSYLLEALQEDNEKATQLLRKVQLLEEAVILTQSPQQRRMLKKQLGWLKSRIKETTNQEKSVLKRLAHLSYEIQSQERWNQVQHERLQHSQSHFQLATNNQSLNPLMNQSMTLDPLSPEFHPSRYQGAYTVWPPQQYQPFNTYNGYFPPIKDYASQFAAQKTGFEEEYAAERFLIKGPSVERSLKKQVTHHKDQLDQRERPPMKHRSSSMDRASFNILATHTPLLEIPQRKRHSLAGIAGTDMTWLDGRAKDKALGLGTGTKG